ncbi:4Fe-4S binding protein [Parasalinivibrio latis]|uniref:4Fe-4S binding protein n=1 Tax=Parasalinivibrio latis TaxID=2952610 RepID=UPI0030DECE09
MSGDNEKYYQAKLSHCGTSRRGLFRAIGRGMKSASEADEPPVINCGRPLGAVEELLFNRLCNRCGECVRACPQQVLSMTTGGPVMDLSLNHCTLCVACTSACQTGALQPGRSRDTGWRPVISSGCNARIMGSCDECETDCPTGAISVSPNRLPVVSDLCNGCGECVSSCYIGAVSLTKAV